MKYSFTILIDMDDVLENLVQCWTAALNERYGTTVKEDDITSWYIADYFPSLSKEQLFGVLQEPDFWENLSPMQNAPEIVEQLVKDGHTVRVVTASHYMTVAPKIKLLLRLYPILKWEDVIIAHDKSLIRGDFLIDDGYHNLESFDGLKLLFDRPHNRNCDTSAHDIMRVHTWDDIYYIITALAKENNKEECYDF